MYCKTPKCGNKNLLDISGIMRRAACGNFAGAKRLMEKGLKKKSLQECLKDMSCILSVDGKREKYRRREILQVLEYLQEYIII